MKKLNFLFPLFLFGIFIVNGFAATPLSGLKILETNIFKLDCSGFTSSAATEMMIAANPYNWTSATGSQWSSSNCFAQNITSNAYIGKTVRFGASGVSGNASTPTLNLSERTGYTTKLRIVLTAGSNKTGSMIIKMDGITTLGTISLTGTSNYDYVYEFDITSLATSNSFLNFEQGIGDGNGFVYVREISIFREPKTYLKLNCQMFNANSSTVASVATAPNNWSVSLGANPASTAYCYANNAINTTYGAGIRMGATTVANSGTFTTLNYDFSPSVLYKIKLYIEILVVNSASTGKLDLKVDNNASIWTYNPTTDNGNNGAVANNTWIPFEVEITGGSVTSNITLFQTRTSETGSFYIRNLRIYKEFPGVPTNVLAVAGNAKAAVSFSGPEITGGSSITGYIVKSYPDGITTSGSTSPIVINGLSNGSNYTFTVKAVNSGGEGAESSQSNVVAPHLTNNIILVNGTVNLSSLTLSPVSDINVENGSSLNINTNVAINSITVFPDAKLTVNDGVSLTATNGITLQNTASGTASFVDSRAADNPSAIAGTVEQAITETNRNWYVAVPVSGKFASDITLNGAKIVQRNEALSRWDDVLSGTTLTPGVGYIAVASATSGTTSWSLSGNLNSGKIEVPVTRSGTSSAGFNLLGNPYPSYLNWEQVLSLNSTNASLLQSSIWYRTKSGASYAFQTYNSAGRVATPTSTTGYIPPMQAFWVRANATGTVIFTNAMRSHGDGASNKLKAPKVNTQQIIRLQVSNTAVADEAVIYIDQNAQNTFDKYDTEKMFNNVASQPELYTKAGTEKLVINGLSEISDNQEIPICFTYTQGGDLKLKLTELSNFDSNTKVYLRDKQENSETELTSETVYAFSTTATSNNESRFSLLFKVPGATTGINNPKKEQVSVFVNTQNQITIIAKPNSNYIIYNAMGQLLENGVINTKNETRNTKREPGVYIVKVNDQSTRVVLK